MPEAKLVLTTMSAADFYRRKFPGFTSPQPAASAFDGPCVYKDEDVRALAPFWLDRAFAALGDGAVHILTRSAAQRGNARGVRAHVWSGDLPANALFEYDENVMIATPGFAFLQLATELSFAELVAYGDEICGCYALMPDEPLGFRVRKTPLTTVEGLKAFVEGAEGMRGYRQATKALPYIVDGSPNPAATVAEILLCLPFHYGGYRLPVPHMGMPIQLSKRASLLLGRPELFVAACWPDQGVSLDIMLDEIAKAKSHANGADALYAEGGGGLLASVQAGGMSVEQIREKALGFAGYDALCIQQAQMCDLDAFESAAISLARKLGKLIPGKKRGPLPQRENLRATLFAWTSAYGHSS